MSLRRSLFTRASSEASVCEGPFDTAYNYFGAALTLTHAHELQVTSLAAGGSRITRLVVLRRRVATRVASVAAWGVAARAQRRQLPWPQQPLWSSRAHLSIASVSTRPTRAAPLYLRELRWSRGCREKEAQADATVLAAAWRSRLPEMETISSLLVCYRFSESDVMIASWYRYA